MSTLTARLGNGAKVHLIALALVALGMTAAYGGGLLSHAPTITHTVKVERSWGTPSQSVDGAQVSDALAGLTCDVYQARKTVVCHP